MTSAAVTAMADAVVAATGFGDSLYPENALCVEDQRVSERVLFVLDDGNEAYPVELSLGHTHLLVGPRAVPIAPGSTQAQADALLRAAAQGWAACDYTPESVAPVAALLPVPAGASVAVLSLCAACHAFLTDTFPSAHFIALED